MISALAGNLPDVNLDKLFPQVFNGQLFFVNGTCSGHQTDQFTDLQNFLHGTLRLQLRRRRRLQPPLPQPTIYGVFAQDDWKVTRNLTLNLGLARGRSRRFLRHLCHIGNIDREIWPNSGQYPMIYGGCANKLNVARLDRQRQRHHLQQCLRHRTRPARRARLRPRRHTQHHDSRRLRHLFRSRRRRHGGPVVASRRRTCLGSAVAAGCVLPITLRELFSQSPAINALPTAGILDPNFVPCQARFTAFPGGDTTPVSRTSVAPRKPRRASLQVPLRAGRAATVRDAQHAAVEP